MKKQFMCVVFGFIMFFSTNAQGAILDVRDGQLFGASDVDVNGVLYDVAFRDGTCIELYGGCDENTDFPFTDPSNLNDTTLIVAAGHALLDQVFIDSPIGAFDSNPNLINGVGAPGGGTAQIPLWANADSGALGVITVRNWRLEHQDVVGAGSSYRTFDTTPRPGFERYDVGFYAVWSRATPVPVPSAFLLFFSALTGVLGARCLRKKSHSRD